MNDLFGIQIIEDASMVDSHSRLKTWRERWLSWPWRPWVKYIVWQEPSKKIYLVNMDNFSEKLICHPAMTERLGKVGKEITISTQNYVAKEVGEVDVYASSPQPGEEW